MNIKKILLISVMAVIVLTSFSVVSAGWFDFGGTTVNGIEFNTTGFKDVGNEPLSEIVVCNDSNVETRTFMDDREHQLSISVFDNPDKNLTLDDIDFQNVSSKNFHIGKADFSDKNALEVVNKKTGLEEFIYEQDGKIVLIQAENPYHSSYIRFKIGDNDRVVLGNIMLT